MFQNFVVFGMIVSMLSSLLGMVYTFFSYTILFDFSNTIPIWKIPVTFLTIGLILSGVYYIVLEKKPVLLLASNICLVILSFLSIILPIVATVPDEFPEMFPIFAIPLHFLLPMFWLAIFPSFYKKYYV